MDLTDLTQLWQGIPVLLLVFARVAALFTVGPAFGTMYVPVQVKALLAAAMTLLIAPLQQAGVAPALDWWFILLLIKEVLVGLSLGFFLDLFVHGVRFGADLANRHAGFSAAEYFNPDTEEMSSPVGDLFNIALMLLFFITNGHHILILSFARSYEMVAFGAFTPNPAMAGALVDATQHVFTIALALSFPVLAAIMAITVAEGVIARAIPQMNMLHFSFALKIMVSLLVLYAGMPAAVAFLGIVLRAMHEAGWAFLQLMGG